MWGKIKALLAGIVFICVGLAFMVGDLTGDNDQRVAQLQELVADPGETMAMLDDQYTEVQKRRRRLPDTTYYEVTFSYKVDGKTYRGKMDVKEEPTVATMLRPIKYHKQKPSIHSFDPQDELETAEATSAVLPWIGPGALLLGVLCLIYVFKSGKQRAVEGGSGRTRRGRRS